MFNFPMLSAHAPLDFIVNFPLFSIILLKYLHLCQCLQTFTFFLIEMRDPVSI